MKLGIIGAMPQEIDSIAKDFERDSIHLIAGREYHCGRFVGIDTVLVFSRWGKVAAAITATTLIERFEVDVILFTGVAGAVSPALNVGDIVIANRLIQHDFDVSAARLESEDGILPRFAIPFLGISFFPVDDCLVELAKQSAEEYLSARPIETRATPALGGSALGGSALSGSVFVGAIASGDQFIADPKKIEELRQSIPNLLCVEMEGAAMAQVCYEHHLPFLVIRAISDKADHSAPVDFLAFVMEVAQNYSHGVTHRLAPKLQNYLAHS